MKVFISYPHCEHGFVADLAGALEKNGFDVFFDAKIPIGSNWVNVLSEELSTADAVIIVFSDKQQSTNVFNEANLASTKMLSSKDGRPLIIPIVIGEKTSDYVPFNIAQFQGIYIEERHQISQAIDTLLFKLNTYAAKKKREENENSKAQILIENELSSRIEDIISDLKAASNRQKWLAGILYIISAIVLLFTIGLAIFFLHSNDLANAKLEQIAVVGIVYLFIAILVVSFSKFLFTLARSFMVEAIRCTDRIHAISFGKFYIKAFDENVTREEVMKIFSNWNIDNGATSFRDQASSDYDPKIHELLGLLKKTGSQ